MNLWKKNTLKSLENENMWTIILSEFVEIER